MIPSYLEPKLLSQSFISHFPIGVFTWVNKGRIPLCLVEIPKAPVAEPLISEVFGKSVRKTLLYTVLGPLEPTEKVFNGVVQVSFKLF